MRRDEECPVRVKMAKKLWQECMVLVQFQNVLIQVKREKLVMAVAWESWELLGLAK
jgi:hypothetical protein